MEKDWDAYMGNMAYLRLGQLHQHLGCWLRQLHLLQNCCSVICDDDFAIWLTDLQAKALLFHYLNC